MKPLSLNFLMKQKYTNLISALFIVTVLYSGASATDLENRVIEHTMQNGLKLLLLERHASPTIATSIMFKVGASDEISGNTGMAHMLEHMLFKGTKTLGTKDYSKEEPLLSQIETIGESLDAEKRKGEAADSDRLRILSDEMKRLQGEHKKFVIKDEFAELYSKNGAVGYNAWTNVDVTTYVLKLPANKLELWAAIEADRWKNPVLREFYKERDVVREERRSSYDNNPSGSLYENLIITAFRSSPYSHPTIGWPTDISFMPKKKLVEFLNTYYVPNNCVISIVGDINPQEVIKMMEKYFGDIPSKPVPARIMTKEMEQKGERRTAVDFDANPKMMIAFHKPTLPHDDDYTFDVIDSVLTGGRTSRLYKRLVLEDKSAVSIWSFGAPGSRHSNLFILSGTPRAPHTTEELEETIYSELERLKTEPVEPRELEKIINQLEASKVRKMRSNGGMASELTYYQTLAGDWRYSVRHLDMIRKVTPEKIMAVAKKYFTKANRTVATLVKKKVSKKQSKVAQ